MRFVNTMYRITRNRMRMTIVKLRVLITFNMYGGFHGENLQGAVQCVTFTGILVVMLERVSEPVVMVCILIYVGDSAKSGRDGQCVMKKNERQPVSTWDRVKRD